MPVLQTGNSWSWKKQPVSGRTVIAIGLAHTLPVLSKKLALTQRPSDVRPSSQSHHPL